MRVMKMFGLAGAAAVVAMAFVGATSASATDTQLCNSHSALICEEGEEATSVSLVNEGVGTLLTDIVDVLCLTISGSGTPLAQPGSQAIDITSLSFTGCGTKAAHNNCEISVLESPSADLLKTGLDAGTLTGTSGEVLVECENVDIFGIDIHCIYDGTGLEFPIGAQHLTANDTPIEPVSGELCPEESFLDGLLETTANRYVLGRPETALCKTHVAEACPQADLAGTVHFVANNPYWEIELTGGAKIKVQCELALMEGTVGNLRAWQEIAVDQLTWTTCTGGGCTVTTDQKAIWRVARTVLNEGSVSVTSRVKFTCGTDIENCVVMPATPWDIKGKGSGSHGRIIVSNGAATIISGKCPIAKFGWNATYESLTDIYVLT